MTKQEVIQRIDEHDLSFSTVLRELDLTAGPDTSAQWQSFAKAQNIVLPAEFLKAMSLGADSLLTQYSNDETLQVPEILFEWDGIRTVPLLWENQGNFVFSLSLDNQNPTQILISHDFTGHHNAYPTNWQVFAPNFTTFACARLIDFQYLFNECTEDSEWFFDDLPFTPERQAALDAVFKCGPTTPEAFELSSVRHRFYRTGQRISVSVDAAGQAYWEISAATQELFDQLYAEIRGEL